MYIETVKTKQEYAIDYAVTAMWKVADAYIDNPYELKVYAEIHKFMNKASYTAKVGIGTIAKAANCSINTVKKYLKELSNKNILAVQHNYVTKEDGTRWNEANTYHFIAEKHGQAKEQKVQAEVKEESSYQAAKKKLSDRCIALAKKFGNSVADIAYRTTSKAVRENRIVSGNYLAYMDSVAEKQFNQREEARKIFDDSDRVMEAKTTIEGSQSPTESDNTSKGSYTPHKTNKANFKKTGFHNFEQRSSKYTNDQLEAMLKAKNR